MGNRKIILLSSMVLAHLTANALEMPRLEMISTSEADCPTENNITMHVKNHYLVRERQSKSYHEENLNSTDDLNYQVCNTDSYGELADLLGDNLFTVDSLVIKGPVGVADFDTLWEASFKGNLQIINLENAYIENLSIPEYAFFHQSEQLSPDAQYIECILLKRIMLPDAVTNIGESAFSYAINLENINMPSSLECIGEYAFSDCISLQTDPLVFPEGVEAIPNMCFLNCKSLTGNVILPNSIKTIGEAAFFQSKVSSVNFPSGLEFLGQAAFYATNLKEAILPNSCLNFQGSSHFHLCRELTKISLPEGLQQIPDCFANTCLSLREIEIPSSVKSIGGYAFWQCRSLQHLELPEELESIGTYGLWYLDSLTEIAFPQSLTTLGMESCEYWANIKKIYCLSEIPPTCIMSTINVGNAPFGNTNSEFYMRTPQETPIYVPTGTADLYRNTEGWDYFINFVETDDFPCGNSVEAWDEKHLNQTNVYDIFGRKIDKMQNGNLYIRDGRKFIYKNR